MVPDAEKHAFGAQLALLHRCTTSIARLLRKRASLLLVAKILAVSRLLHNTLSQHHSTPPFLEDLRKQLAYLRQSLLKRIDKRLASTNVTEDGTIESLAAYCLATSTSSDDAIHRFQQVRLDVIVSQLDISCKNIPKSLRLFVRTLQTSKILRSRQFTDVLSKIKARPILSDPEIRNLDGLDIDILGRWAAPEVNNFIPWIKLSGMSRSEGAASIKEWSQQAFEKLAEGCQKSLADSTGFSELLSLRADSIELWLSSWGSIITHSSAGVLERLRSIFNDHLKRILTAQMRIDDVAGRISAAITGWEAAEHSSVESLWDSDLTTADFSNGAGAFKQAVTDRLLGRDDDVSVVLKKYQLWLASVQEVNDSIESLRRLKWTDIFVGAEVDDEDIDITPQLNENDPDFLSESLQSAVRQAFDTLQTSFSDAFNTLGTSHRSEKAAFLLRLVRFVRRDIPRDFIAKGFEFSSELVPELQKLLASEIVAEVGTPALVPGPEIDPRTGKARIVPGRSLWEGNPVVPVQPSPGTFKFLRRLTAIMDKGGADLWDPSTLKVFKQTLQEQLEKFIGSTLDELEDRSTSSKDLTEAEAEQKKSSTNGDAKDQDASASEQDAGRHDSVDPSHVDALRDWKTQLFFDAIYLANMLGDESQLSNLVDRVQKSAEASVEAANAVRKFAGEYWKRTELLFGLLAER